MTDALPAGAAAQTEARRKSVTIVGAGFVGLSAALWLQRQGHQVVVIDPHLPLDPETPWKQAASFGNACTFAPHGVVPVAMPGLLWQVPGMLLDPRGPLAFSWRYLPHMVPWLVSFLKAGRRAEVERIVTALASLLQRADAAWSPLIADAGAQDMLRHAGCLYLYRSEAEYRNAGYGNALRRRHGVTVSDVTFDEIRDLEPHLAPVYQRGVLFDDAYTVRSPAELGRRMARAVLAQGGSFLRGTVRGLQPDATGPRFSLNGSDHRADHLVITGGARSGSLVRELGDRVRLDTERGYHVIFPEAGELVNRPVCFTRHGFYMTPMADGLRAAGTVEFGGLNPKPTRTRLEVIAKTVPQLLPGAGPRGTEWLGFRPSMPDSLPVICNAPSIPHVTYAFGHGHLGLTLAGITGRLVADLVAGQPPEIDLSPFRSDRF